MGGGSSSSGEGSLRPGGGPAEGDAGGVAGFSALLEESVTPGGGGETRDSGGWGVPWPCEMVGAGEEEGCGAGAEWGAPVGGGGREAAGERDSPGVERS